MNGTSKTVESQGVLAPTFEKEYGPHLVAQVENGGYKRVYMRLAWNPTE